MAEYTIKDLSTALNKTEQSLYKLIKKNDELAKLIDDNSREIGTNHKKLYGEPVLEWLIKHYKLKSSLTDDSVGVSSSGEKTEDEPKITPRDNDSDTVDKPVDYKKKYKRLKKQYDELAEAYDNLSAMFENERNEKQAILKLFAMEKAEKQALLPAPKKKHWWNR